MVILPLAYECILSRLEELIIGTVLVGSLPLLSCGSCVCKSGSWSSSGEGYPQSGVLLNAQILIPHVLDPCCMHLEYRRNSLLWRHFPQELCHELELQFDNFAHKQQFIIICSFDLDFVEMADDGMLEELAEYCIMRFCSRKVTLWSHTSECGLWAFQRAGFEWQIWNFLVSLQEGPEVPVADLGGEEKDLVDINVLSAVLFLLLASAFLMLLYFFMSAWFLRVLVILFCIGGFEVP